MRGESEKTNTANGQSQLGGLVATITRKILENDAFEVDLQQLAQEDPKKAEELQWFIPWLKQLVRRGAEATDSDQQAAIPRQLGEFQLVREIGRGGMGIVYEALQTSLEKRVALKILPFTGVLDTKNLQRFKNEARAAAQLQHPNIVSVNSFGMERGVHFYAMQYIDGQDLAQVIRNLRAAKELAGRPLPSQSDPGPRSDDSDATRSFVMTHRRGSSSTHDSERVFDILSSHASSDSHEFFDMVAQLGIQACEGLHYAHSTGVVHRDIKPSNLLLDHSGNLLISDFGLAQVQGDPALTITGDFVGTLRYMSPEQALANRVVVDHRTDIYSMGVTLYELLTLKRACDGESREEILRHIAFDEPVTPRKVNRKIPVEFETVVLKAMAKNPDERYQTADEFAVDLRCLRADEPIRARRPTLAQRATKFARRHKPLMWSGAALLFMFMLASWLGAVVIWQDKEAARKELKDKSDAYALEKQQREQVQRLLQRSEGLRCATQSSLALERDPALAVLLGIEAVERYPRLESNTSLLRALNANHELRTLQGPTDGVGQVCFSPTGDRVITAEIPAGLEAPARPAAVFDVATGEALCTLGDQTRITSISISPDGGRILSSTHPWFPWFIRFAQELSPHPPSLWDVVTGRKLLTLDQGYLFRADERCFSPDGMRVVTSTRGNDAVIWDCIGGHQLNTLSGHEDHVISAFFSPDGALVVTVSADQKVRIWDADSGALKNRIAWQQKTKVGSNPHVTSVCFSPDVMKLLTGSREFGIQIWDVQSGEEIGPQRWPHDRAVFDATGRLVISHESFGKEVEVRDLQSGKVQLRLTHQDRLEFMQIDSESRHLITLTNTDRLRLWDLRSGQQLAELKGHRGAVVSVRFSPDGHQVVSGGRDGTARVWDVEPGSARVRFDVDVSDSMTPYVAYHPAKPIAFVSGNPVITAEIWDSEKGNRVRQWTGEQIWPNQPNSIFAVCADSILRVVDSSTTEPLATFDFARGELDAVRLSTDGRVAAIQERGGSTLIWNIEADSKLELPHQTAVSELAVSPNGKILATAHADGLLSLWDMATGKQSRQLRHDGPVKYVEFDSAGKRLASLTDQDEIAVWDAATGERITQASAPGAYLSHIQFHSDLGHLLAYHHLQTDAVRVWSVENGELVAKCDNVTGRVRATFHPSLPRVVISSGQGVLLWDYEAGSELRLSDVQSSAIDFSPDGTHVAAASYVNPNFASLQEPGTIAGPPAIRIWNVEDGRLVKTIDVGNVNVERLRFLAEPNQLFVSAYSYGGALVDIDHRSTIAPVHGHAAPVSVAAFSNDGKQLVTASNDGAAGVWDVEQAKLVQLLRGHSAAVTDVAYSPDGTSLATASADHRCIEWRRDNWQVSRTLNEHHDQVWSVVYSPDGKWIATVSRDGTAVLRSQGQTVVLKEKQSIVCLKFQPGGEGLLVATGLVEHPKVVDRKGNPPPGQAIEFLPESPQNPNATYSVKVYKAVVGEHVELVHDQPLASANYGPSGKRVVTVTQDGQVAIWDAETGERQYVVARPVDPIRFAAFSSDGRHVMTTQGNSTSLWTVIDERLLEVVTIDADGFFRAGGTVAPRHPHPPFTPDGKWLVTISNKSVRRWPLDLIGYAKQIAPRTLSDEEKDDLFISADSDEP